MNRHYNSFLRRFATVLGSAVLLFFGSEFLFLEEQPVRRVLEFVGHPDLLFKQLATGILSYAVVAYAFCILAHRYRQSWSSLLLVGALCGWIIEGTLGNVLYEAIPFSFMWPAVGWHALITVGICWLVLRQLMFRYVWWQTVLGFAALGVFWGFWATWSWIDPSTDPTAPLTISQFAIYVAHVYPLLPLGLLLLDWKGTHAFKPTQAEHAAIGATVLLLSMAQASGPFPASLGFLPLLAVTLLALEAARPHRLVIPPLEAFEKNAAPRWHYLLTLATPLLAIPTYWAMLYTGPLLAGDAMAGGMMLIGGFIFAVALINCAMTPLAARVRPQLPRPKREVVKRRRPPNAAAKPVRLEGYTTVKTAKPKRVAKSG